MKKTRVFTKEGNTGFFSFNGFIPLNRACFKALTIPKEAKSIQAVFTKKPTVDSISLAKHNPFFCIDFCDNKDPDKSYKYFHILYW